jgi:tetratricopeptide (TPR) repeat protein
MIELLLAADRLLAEGFPGGAERLYAQVAEADPRNAIAVVGLARVARARGDEAAALDYARRALAIDPEDVAARRLLQEGRGPADAAAPMAVPAASSDPAAAMPAEPAAIERAAPVPTVPCAEPAAGVPAIGEPAVAPARRSFLARIRAFLGIGR